MRPGAPVRRAGPREILAVQPLVLLLISVLLLALAPWLLAQAQRVAGAMQLLDGFVLVAVGGLVVGDLIPHAFEGGGWLVLPLVLLGLLGPSLLERWLHRAAAKVHLAALVLGLGGLMLHAMLDGLALSGTTRLDSPMAMAVLLHRLPEGLTLWWLLRPTYGSKVAAAALAAVAVATSAGMALPTIVSQIGGLGLSCAQALVSGSLLHVVLHRPHPISRVSATGWRKYAAGMGGLLGAALLVAVLRSEHGHTGDTDADGRIFSTFNHLFAESAPALLIAYAAAGLVQVWLPAAPLAWLRRGGTLRQALAGTAFGIPLPICSCGVVPVYRGLVQQGVPAAAALAFLIATPELGLDAVLLSLPLLGKRMALARVVAAAAVAVLTGWLLGRLPALAATPTAQPIADKSLAAGTHAPWPRRVFQGLRVGLGEITDHTGPWILLGLLLAAGAEPVLGADMARHIAKGWDVPILALLGMPAYVCASGATPLVAALLVAGISPGAGLAFLITGPATNITTLGVLARLHGIKGAVAFAFVITVLAVTAGYITNQWIGAGWQPTAVTAGAEPAVKQVFAWILAGLFTLSLLRQGPRRFIGQVLDFALGDGGHDHAHGPSHDLESSANLSQFRLAATNVPGVRAQAVRVKWQPAAGSPPKP